MAFYTSLPILQQNVAKNTLHKTDCKSHFGFNYRGKPPVSDHPTSNQSYIFKVEHHSKTTQQSYTWTPIVNSNVYVWLLIHDDTPL